MLIIGYILCGMGRGNCSIAQITRRLSSNEVRSVNVRSGMEEKDRSCHLKAAAGCGGFSVPSVAGLAVQGFTSPSTAPGPVKSLGG